MILDVDFLFLPVENGDNAIYPDSHTSTCWAGSSLQPYRLIYSGTRRCHRCRDDWTESLSPHPNPAYRVLSTYSRSRNTNVIIPTYQQYDIKHKCRWRKRTITEKTRRLGEWLEIKVENDERLCRGCSRLSNILSIVEANSCITVRLSWRRTSQPDTQLYRQWWPFCQEIHRWTSGRGKHLLILREGD